MWHRLRHWISCERLLFVIQVIIVVGISIITNLLHVDVIWLLRGRHADSQHYLRTIQHCGSFAEAAGEETGISVEGARDEEDETSDCPMEQVVEENPSTIAKVGMVVNRKWLRMQTHIS